MSTPTYNAFDLLTAPSLITLGLINTKISLNTSQILAHGKQLTFLNSKHSTLLRIPETHNAFDLLTGHHHGINKYSKYLQMLFKYCHMVNSNSLKQ